MAKDKEKMVMAKVVKIETVEVTVKAKAMVSKVEEANKIKSEWQLNRTVATRLNKEKKEGV